MTRAARVSAHPGYGGRVFPSGKVIRAGRSGAPACTAPRTQLHTVVHGNPMRSGQPCDPAQTEALREVKEVNVMTGASRIAGTPGGGEWLTVEEVCAELKISPRTFYRWRAQGTGPRSKRIAKGGVRIRRSWLDEWLDEPEQDIA